MYSSGYPPPGGEGMPQGAPGNGAPPGYNTPVSQPPPGVAYPSAQQQTFPSTYSFTQFPPPGLPGVGLPGYPVGGQPYPGPVVTSQPYPTPVATSTAPPASHPSQHYPPPVTVNVSAPAYTTHLAASQGANNSMYPQFASVGGYNIPGYPPGVQPGVPNNQPPPPWPHPQFQECLITPGVPYPYHIANQPHQSSVPPPHYEESSKTSRSPSRRDMSPRRDLSPSSSRRRSKSPTRRRSSKSPRRSSRSPSTRRRDRSSTDWKRTSYSRDRSSRRSDDRRARSPDRKDNRSRSKDRKESRQRSNERKDARGRSQDRKESRARSSDRKESRMRSPDRKDARKRSPERKESSNRMSDRKDSRRTSSLNNSSSRQRISEKRNNRSRQSIEARSPEKKLKKRPLESEKKRGRSNERESNDRHSREDRNDRENRHSRDDKSSSSKSDHIKKEPADNDNYEVVKREVDPLLDDSDTESTARAKNKSTSNNRPFIDLNPADHPMSNEEIIAMEKKIWIRSTPADLYYSRDPQNAFIMKSTEKGKQLQDSFVKELIMPGVRARTENPTRTPPSNLLKHHHHHHKHDHGDEDCDSDDEDEEMDDNGQTESQKWLEYRSQERNRTHSELWQNLPGELNDGPSCRCSKKARENGIRHGVWVGEEEIPKPLDPATNNFYDLYHYRITISPPTNFLVGIPTMISHDEHDFLFEGFSMFTRRPIPEFPVCKIIRFNIEYSILFFQERMPENFTINELDLFSQYFFHELLELWDWKLDQRFIFMPRFARDLPDNGKELLSMNEVLTYLLNSYKPLINKSDLQFIHAMQDEKWEKYKAKVRGMLVTNPGMAPSTIRVDHVDRDHDDSKGFPEIVHFGLKPSQLCYAGNTEYQKQYRDYVKYRHLLANMPKPSAKDKQEYENMETRLMELRANTKMKRDTTVVVSSQGFYRTGLMADIVQHAMLLPVLVHHLRFHFSLEHLEEKINYRFQNRFLLQQALTHPSYKENFGTNPDHVRNTLSNCGIRQPEYGDKKVHSVNSRKRGINTLINIMSKMGRKDVTESKVKHNERLEYLGDAVVEFITSAHLFYLFPDLEEGGLATYRSAIVLNQNLADLALALGLEKYILFSHGPDLCNDAELRHAMANCFEAFIGAIFLDGGINVADQVFNKSMFESDRELYEVWGVLPLHPLQTQEPGGDRHWIDKFPHLKKLVNFEEEVGIEFKHIRLLARAFTDRSVGINNLTLGSNQRLEFLGDSVLQLVTSEFLYKHFPDHHEGHLSLLRASLVNNRTQAVVCDDLGMSRYAVYSNIKTEVKIKDKADLLEAFLGALYVDKDLYYVQVFAQVCFFPRLYQFILNQDWNDPKSKLQQCCLTLRTMDGRAPDIPIYKVIECKGPTNTRVYTVAVYFRGQRLAKARGHSIQQAEFNSAEVALKDCAHLFPHLNYQKRVLMRSFKNQGIDYLKYKREEEAQNKKQDPLGAASKTDSENSKKDSSTKKDKLTAKDKDDRGNRKSYPHDRRHSLERRPVDGHHSYDRYQGDSYGDRGSRLSRDGEERPIRSSFDGGKDRYYDQLDRESSKRRLSDSRARKDDQDRRLDNRRLRREAKADNKKGKSSSGSKNSKTTSPNADTEMISEDENMDDNMMEDMVKDAVQISDDEISLSADNLSKKDSSDDGGRDMDESSLKDFEEDNMADIINNTEDISADEGQEEGEIDSKDSPEQCNLSNNDANDVEMSEDVKVKIELDFTASDNATSKHLEVTESVTTVIKEERSNSPIGDSVIKVEIDNTVVLSTTETIHQSTNEDLSKSEKDKSIEKELPTPSESRKNSTESMTSDANSPSEETPKSHQKTKPKKKKKLKSERVKKEIEEIENKLAKKKAKAAKLAEKERKRKEKLKLAQTSNSSKETAKPEETVESVHQIIEENDKNSSDKQKSPELTPTTKQIALEKSKSDKPNTNPVLPKIKLEDGLEGGNSDLEEGECSDDDDEPPLATPAPPQPPPPVQKDPAPKTKEEKVASIKPFKIQDRKELQSSKQDKDKHEKKELTEKEKEREEKKKRWRRESPKRSHKDRDHRDEKRRTSSHHRSPSPRDRGSKFYDFEHRRHEGRAGGSSSSYYDHPSSRSPLPASYYDYYERGSSSRRNSRSPRSSSSRRSARSPERSSRYSGSGYESARESRDYRY